MAALVRVNFRGQRCGLKSLDLFVVGLAASVTGDSQLPRQSASPNTPLHDVR